MRVIYIIFVSVLTLFLPVYLAAEAGAGEKETGGADFRTESADTDSSLGTVTITYTLYHIPKMASNQLAVWIEDPSGKYITTLFATRFMAGGGYKKRPDCCPEWVDSVAWADIPEKRIDTVSGATQSPGRISLEWDCTDWKGSPVPAGKYVYKVEGNIYWQNRVVWEGTVRLGHSRDESTAEAHYIPADAPEEGTLLEDVGAVFVPAGR